MKAILSAALVLGLCGLADARDQKAGPVGTWKLEYEVGGQKREATLAVRKDGDRLAGKMTWQDRKESKLKDVKLTGGDLTFSAEREVNDMTFTISYKLKVDGDKIKGKAEADIGGEKRAFDIEGRREKADQ
jgi:hypothetical protein